MRRFATITLAGALLALAPLAARAAGVDPLAPPPSGQPQPPPPPPESPPPVPPPATVIAPPPPMGAQKETGIAVEVHLGTSVVTINTGGGGGNTISIGMIQGGLFGGYKIGRFVFGIGLDLQRVATGSSSSTQTDQSRSDTLVMVIPGVRAALLRSSDQRVELFGQFDLGLGGTITSTTPSPPPPQPDTSNFHISYLLGLGLRYWMAPQFAFSAVGALHGDFTTSSTSMMTMMGTTTQNNSTGVTSIVAQLQVLAVF